MGPFNRRGIRIHDPAAKSYGALTPEQQDNQAQQVALEQDPIVGSGALPQNELKKFSPGGYQ